MPAHVKKDVPGFIGNRLQHALWREAISLVEHGICDAKTVDEFAQDNITQNNARDWLTAKYPDSLGINTGTDSDFADDGTQAPPSPKLEGKGDDLETALQTISKDVGLLKPITDLSDQAEEARLVQAARLQMAQGRQQLLASMVMMGISRIVVTDGLINAKVIFDMRAQDTASRKAPASMADVGIILAPFPL